MPTSSLPVIFFEDQHCKKFQPLTLTRPMTDLRVGILTILEKWQFALEPESVFEISDNNRITIAPEKQPVPISGQFPDDEDYLLINSRLLPGKKIVEALGNLTTGDTLFSKGSMLCGRVSGQSLNGIVRDIKSGNPNSVNLMNTISNLFKSPLQIPVEGIQLMETIPDLLTFNGREIESDIHLMNCKRRGANIQLSPHALLYFENNIFIGDHSVIEPGATLIAEDGPVYIGSHVIIQAGALIRGPVSVGDGTTIKMGAKIYGETTIGPVCEVAGEVQNTIFHSYSNKAHDGFVGNSVFGQWCNLGADTNTSNLKNNYSTVTITDWDSQTDWDTGSQFLGTIMGDHSKTGINTMLNTGTVIGVSCNVFGGGFPPKYIPSFSWADSGSIESYKADKAFETMKKVMARRHIDISADYIEMMRQLADNR